MKPDRKEFMKKFLLAMAPQLYEELKKRAAAAKRSVTQEINVILEDVIKIDKETDHDGKVG